jgi:hypothetical protein
MIVTDLSYLEEAPNSLKLTGGARKKPLFSSQINIALVKQKAIASSKAVSYGGDAIAISYAQNNSDIDQDNA